MICPNCKIRWADFPIDITKRKMTRKQELGRLTVFNNDDHEVCPACQADMWEHTYCDEAQFVE